jgi:hypothetical protein
MVLIESLHLKFVISLRAFSKYCFFVLPASVPRSSSLAQFTLSEVKGTIQGSVRYSAVEKFMKNV